MKTLKNIIGRKCFRNLPTVPNKKYDNESMVQLIEMLDVESLKDANPEDIFRFSKCVAAVWAEAYDISVYKRLHAVLDKIDEDAYGERVCTRLIFLKHKIRLSMQQELIN